MDGWMDGWMDGINEGMNETCLPICARQLGDFHDVLHMMLQQVPHISDCASSTKSDRRLSVTSDEDSLSEIFPTSNC